MEARKAETDRRHAKDLVRRAEPARARTHEGRHAWQLATATIVVIAACIGGFLVNGSVAIWKAAVTRSAHRSIGPTPLSRGRTLRLGIGKRHPRQAAPVDHVRRALAARFTQRSDLQGG